MEDGTESSETVAMVDEAVETARKLVAEQFPGARAAWLGGSVIRGDASATSDLDITVLLTGPPAPRRRSLEYGGWPVELFVHTEDSLKYFCEKDQNRRQPTMMRLVGESRVLVDTDGSALRLQRAYVEQVEAGPKPLTQSELDLLRYTVTDLVHDLIGADDNDVRTAIVSTLWQDAARLLLTGARHWAGTGKGLLRELTAYDATHGSNHATALPAAVRAAVAGDISALVEEADRILALYGGRLFAGFELTADLPTATTS